MSTSTTLIQPQEVVNNGILNGGPISDRFDSALLASHVKAAEIRFLRPLLCEDFYLYLIDQKENDISNYNESICPVVEAYPNDATLEKLWTEYILPFLSHCVLWQAAPFIGVQIGSNGIFSMNTQFSETQGIEGVKFVQDTLLNTIEILKEELRRHLCENQDLYPLFCADCHCKCDCGNESCDECKRSSVHAPKMGIVLGKKKHYKKDKFYKNY